MSLSSPRPADKIPVVACGDIDARLRRLEAAIDTWGIGIYEHDHVSGEIYGSARTRELYGLGPDVPLTIEVFAHSIFPADIAIGAAALAESHKPESGGRFEALHRIIRRDGAVRWVHTRAQTVFHEVDGERRPLLTTGSIMDMTERHELELALERQEKRLNLAIQSSQVGVFDWDHHPVRAEDAVYWSQRFRALTGFDEKAPPDISWYVARIHPDDEPTFQRAMTETLDPEVRAAFDVEYRWHHPDGSLHWHLARSSTSFQVVEGKLGPLKTVGAVLDVTSTKLLEEQVHHAQKMKAIGQLAAGIAHDFNNLLSVIHGFSELAAMNLGENHPARADVREVQLASDRAAALTRGLLAFGRKQLIRPRVFDLNELLYGGGQMYRRLIDESITLRLVMSEGALRVKADPNQVEQVLLNLIVNARDAMPNGGELTVELCAEFTKPHNTTPPLDLPAGHYAVMWHAE
jgi:signal transduction histidine kinase